MLNKVLFMATIISNKTRYDQYNNMYLDISIIEDLPNTTVNGENRYNKQIFTIAIHNRLHKYVIDNCYCGQRCYMEGKVIGVNGIPIILIDNISLIERKDGYIRKNNGFMTN